MKICSYMNVIFNISCVNELSIIHRKEHTQVTLNILLIVLQDLEQLQIKLMMQTRILRCKFVSLKGCLTSTFDIDYI